MSSTSSAPVDSRAGRIAAKIAIEMVLEPGRAVLDRPTMTAETPSNAHAATLSSGIRTTAGRGSRGTRPAGRRPPARSGSQAVARAVLGQQGVDHPRGPDRRLCRVGAPAPSGELVDDRLDEGQLHRGRVGRRDLLLTVGGGEPDRLLAEAGELHRAGAAEDAHLVALLGGVVAPQAGAEDTGLELEGPGHGVLRSGGPGEPGGVAAHPSDRAEEVVEQVEGVAGEVDEVPAPADLGPHPPRRVGAVVDDGGLGSAHRHRVDLPDGAVVQELLDGGKARHGTPVVGHEQRQPGLFGRREHVLALRGRARHRLLDVDRLARRQHPHRVVPVGVGWGGDVHGVHLGVVDERLGVVVPARHAVPAGVVGRLGTVAAHHRDQLRTGGLLEAGPALDLGDVADPDDPPAHGPHRLTVAEVVHRSAIALKLASRAAWVAGMSRIATPTNRQSTTTSWAIRLAIAPERKVVSRVVVTSRMSLSRASADPGWLVIAIVVTPRLAASETVAVTSGVLPVWETAMSTSPAARRDTAVTAACRSGW